MTQLYTTRSEEETRALGEALAQVLAPDGVLLMTGDLGSGKTVLTQGLALGLGIEPKHVQSPSFTLIREHEGAGGCLIHVDLYRLDETELQSLGLWEVLAGPGVKAVEWGEKLPFALPGAVSLVIEVIAPSDHRRIEIDSAGRPGLELNGNRLIEEPRV